MNPNVYFPSEFTTAERVYLLLGGVPYPALVFGPVRAEGEFAAGVELAMLNEAVPGEITSSTATSGYEFGTEFPCSWSGERHPTDERRMLRPCDAATGDPIPE